MNNKENGIPGYEGICRECFCPIKTGEGFRFRDKGLLFHTRCVDEHPNGYYIKLERRRVNRSKTVAQKIQCESLRCV